MRANLYHLKVHNLLWCSSVSSIVVGVVLYRGAYNGEGLKEHLAVIESKSKLGWFAPLKLSCRQKLPNMEVNLSTCPL